MCVCLKVKRLIFVGGVFVCARFLFDFVFGCLISVVFLARARACGIVGVCWFGLVVLESGCLRACISMCDRVRWSVFSRVLLRCRVIFSSSFRFRGMLLFFRDFTFEIIRFHTSNFCVFRCYPFGFSSFHLSGFYCRFEV